MEVGGSHIGRNMVVMGRFSILAALIAALSNAACGPGMQKNLLPLDDIGNCPELTDETLAKSWSTTQTMSVHELNCALNSIRIIKVPQFEHAIAASGICSILAENIGLSPNGSGPRERLAWEGVQWSEYAVSSGGYSIGEAHYYMAVNLGLAVRNTVITALKNLGRLEKELQMAVKMAPETDHGGPMRVLGFLYVQAPSWPQGIGDPDRGLELLEQATTEFPDFPLNHIYLAKALWEVEEDDALDSVREHIQIASSQMKTNDWGPRELAWDVEIKHIVHDADISID